MNMNEKHEACEKQDKGTLFKIGTFAQMNRVTIKALRFYETEGLLKPAYIDEESGYRYYEYSQMADVHRILALKESGFTLDDIKKVNKGKNKQEILSKRKAEILQKISELTKMLSIIDSKLFDEDALDAPVMIKKIPSVLVAKMDCILNSYDELFDYMPEFGMEMEKIHLECSIPEYCYTEYLEEGYQEEDVKVSICQGVVKEEKGNDKIHFEKTEEVMAACIYHKGSYADFPKTYASVLKYIADNGYEIIGNIREVYIDGVWNKEKEEDWLSEIEVPVKKK